MKKRWRTELKRPRFAARAAAGALRFFAPTGGKRKWRRHWLRKKALPDVGDSATMQQQRPLKASALWSVWNWTADRLWSGRPDDYLRVRYEDFVRAPKETVEAIESGW